MSSYDVIVVGGGMVGLSCALALSKRTPLSIAVLEAHPEAVSWKLSDYSPRVSAITLASKQLFQALGVWQSIAEKRVSPFTQIQVWSADHSARLEFNSQEIGESVLGYIIENNLIQSVLAEKIKSNPRINYLHDIHLAEFSENKNHIELKTSTGEYFTAKLAIGADGASSWLRQAAGIAVRVHDYAEEAIVATVETRLEHQKIARQWFLEAGPLGFLPLIHSKQSSFVWTLPVDQAKEYMHLTDAEFLKKLTDIVQWELGEIGHIEKRFSYPLRKQNTQEYCRAGLALIGDAAHTVHPLAGQGVNMGLLDAAALVDVIVDAIAEKRDYASHATLRRYERWRRADNMPLLSGIDIIKTLFVRWPRASVFGMDVLNQATYLKKKIINQAVGKRVGLPKLAQVLNLIR